MITTSSTVLCTSLSTWLEMRTVRPDRNGMLVTGAGPREVGAAAYAAGIELHQLSPRGVGLEDVFFQLTRPDGGPPRHRADVATDSIAEPTAGSAQ